MEYRPTHYLGHMGVYFVHFDHLDPYYVDSYGVWSHTLGV